MSPTSLLPGSLAVKSQPTRSAAGTALASGRGSASVDAVWWPRRFRSAGATGCWLHHSATPCIGLSVQRSALGVTQDVETLLVSSCTPLVVGATGRRGEPKACSGAVGPRGVTDIQVETVGSYSKGAREN